MTGLPYENVTTDPESEPPVTGIAVPRAVAPAAAPPVYGEPTYEEPLNPGAGRALGGVGIAVALFGAWAGIVAFAGPAFGYGATGTGAWHWDLEHALLWCLPGAVAVAIGLFLLARASTVSAGLSRTSELVSGVIVACCGAWLVIGPAAWRVLEGHAAFASASPWRSLVDEIGYSFGPGALLALLGGAVVGAMLLVEPGALPVRSRPSPVVSGGTRSSVVSAG